MRGITQGIDKTSVKLFYMFKLKKFLFIHNTV